MADSALRAQRAAALEAKKRRLDELKARRNKRGEDSAKVREKASSNLDEYIDGLLSTTPPGSSPKAEAAASASTVDASTVDQAATTTDSSDSKPAEAPETPKAAEVAPVAPVVKVETFTVSTQTEEEDFPPPSSTADEEEQQELEENDAVPEKVGDQMDAEEVKEKLPKKLSEDAMEREVTSEPFSSFLNTASKKVERMLGTPLLADLLVDYVGEDDSAKRAKKKDSDGSRFLSSRQVYECEKWTARRDVTDMDWSPLHRELMLSSYHAPSSTSHATLTRGSAAVAALSSDDTPSASMAPRSGELMSDGLALVWSLAMPSRPEHIFTCGSPVTAARFHPTEAPLVIGGCQSGQLVVWDVRAGRLPVQRSSMTMITGSGGSKGHVHPICSMTVVENGSGLVTAGSDGRVCFWSLANLRDPAETLQVGDSISSLTVAPESDTLICGDETGALHIVQSAQSGAGQRSRRQVRKMEAEEAGHYGMVTSISTKTLGRDAASRSAGFSKGFFRGSAGLVLSSGVDWTAKLWAPAYTDKPIMSLVSHSYDYMSDVKWSPSHPSLFATASSNGTVGLWNLASSLEEAITGADGILVEPDAGSGRGLNKLRWSADGRRMMVASADRVHVLSLSEDVVRQKGDEDSQMMDNLVSRGFLERG